MDVVITAAAVRTALGSDAAAVNRALGHPEKSAVGPIVGLDTSGFGDDIEGAQIWREPQAPEDDPALRILGPHGRLLDAVALEAHAAAGLETFPREEVGLFVGMGMVDSPVEDLAAAVLAARDGGDAMSMKSFFAGAYRQIHPLWPLSMLNNVAAGQIAIDLDIRGDNLVLAADSMAGLRALLEAARSVDEGFCRAALAAGVSGRLSPASLARDALGHGRLPGEGGAALVFEREADARARGARILGYVRGGATAYGDGAVINSWVAATQEAGGDTGKEIPATPVTGNLGPAAAAVTVAATLAAWPKRLAGKMAGIGVGGKGGVGFLVIEEAP